jgi:hypothetical protein
VDQGRHTCAIVNLALVSVPLRGSVVTDVDDDEVQTKVALQEKILILDWDPQDRHSTRDCWFQYPRHDKTRHDAVGKRDRKKEESGR